MIGTEYSVKIDEKAVGEMEKAMRRALSLMAYELQGRIRDAQVIPRDTGALQGEKFYVDDSQVDKGIVELVHEGPYARRLYYHPEYNFRKDQNPYAQGLWFQLWQKGGIYEFEPVDIYEDALAEILKGRI